MKVFGALENAQLELLVADPAVNPVARMYFNTVTAQPKMYMGTGWLSIYAIGLKTKAVNYALTPSDEAIVVDATAGNVALTLPLASSCPNKRYRLIKKDATGNNAGFITSGADTLNGGTTLITTTQYAPLYVSSDGTNWWGF